MPLMAFRDTPRASGGDETMDGLSCPHLIEKSAHISVHIHVDRRMDRVYDVKWTDKSVHISSHVNKDRNIGSVLGPHSAASAM